MMKFYQNTSEQSYAVGVSQPTGQLTIENHMTLMNIALNNITY